LGVTALEGLVPATLDSLEEAFPRDRFLALDVETTGLSAACDGVRTVQLADGESAAMVVFDRPVAARALVVLANFLRGRRVVAHNARFESSWLQRAGIDLVLDDTVLLFSAVRGTRSPKGGKRTGGGRVSLAALAVMVLGETLDKSEQVSDWAAATLSASQLGYALDDAVVTHRIWEALRAELHRKSKQHGVDIVAGYEDMRFSAVMAHSMERAGIGFDVAAHQAWIARKQETVTAIEAHLAACDPALSPACIASGVQLDRLFRQRLESYAAKDWRPALLAWPKTEKTRRLSFGREDLAAVSLPIVCSLPSGDWLRHSIRGLSRCAAWRRSARRSLAMSSTGGCMVSCMLAGRSPGATPVPIQICRTFRPIRNSVASSVLPTVVLSSTSTIPNSSCASSRRSPATPR
jgi:ribonuclease D